MSATRANYALIARAARMIQNNADCLRQCHATNGDWGADREMQQIHDQEVSTAKALRALLVATPEKTPPKLPEGEVLLHLARVVGLRSAMHGIDATRAKDLLWMFLVKALAAMDETDVVDAELASPTVEYADDLAVAERGHG
jgi:urease accessory protein UreF